MPFNFILCLIRNQFSTFEFNSTDFMKYELYFFVIGCRPQGRNTEQHDVFLTVAESPAQTEDQLINFWPEANGKFHIDSWRKITRVNGHRIEVVLKEEKTSGQNPLSLFFLNLGGYKPNDMEEYHYKEFVVAKDKSEAIALSKQSAFYKHTGFKGAESHIDDKFGIDVDDIYSIEELLPEEIKSKFSISISPTDQTEKDEFHVGYLTIEKLMKLT